MIKALFLFNRKNNNEEIIFKFGLWSRYFFPQYFTSEDAPFHQEMDEYNLQAYKGELTSFVNVAFRGASKTARTKLLIAFCVANDEDQHRRYIRILSDDIDNAKQSVLDIYNMFVYCKGMYPEIFAKTKIKREETMGEFTTTTGIKLLAKPVGVSQRGKIMEDAKSDFDYYDDFESRTTLRSAVKTKMISDNMEEARTGLAIGGSSIYTCNYISEAGNVHQLIHKKATNRKVLIIPIEENKKSNWNRYSLQDIENMRQDDEDFEGERMCLKPNTLVKTIDGLKEIRNIKKGDLVLTHLGNFKKVLKVFKRNATDLLEFTVNNKKFTITRNHPILINRNGKSVWMKAGEIKLTDLIINI